MSKLVLIYDSSGHKMEGCFSIVLSSKNNPLELLHTTYDF